MNVKNHSQCLKKYALKQNIKQHKLTLAPDKTEAVILKGSQKRSNILEGMSITPIKAVKHLGITIDDRGAFGKRIEAVVNKAKSN